MTTLAPHAPRTARRTRLAGVDAARGLAVLGMVAVHVLPTDDRDGQLTLPEAIAGGRSSAAFAVLAGVGVALATRRGADRARSGCACCCGRCSSARSGCSWAGSTAAWR